MRSHCYSVRTSWKFPPVDPEIKRNIEVRIRDARREMELCEEERLPLVPELEQLDQRENAYNALIVSAETTP